MGYQEFEKQISELRNFSGRRDARLLPPAGPPSLSKLPPEMGLFRLAPSTHHWSLKSMDRVGFFLSRKFKFYPRKFGFPPPRMRIFLTKIICLSMNKISQNYHQKFEKIIVFVLKILNLVVILIKTIFNLDEHDSFPKSDKFSLKIHFKAKMFEICSKIMMIIIPCL